MSEAAEEYYQDLVEALSHFPIGEGYYSTSVSVPEAQAMVTMLREAGLLPTGRKTVVHHGRQDAEGAGSLGTMAEATVRASLLEGEEVVRSEITTFLPYHTEWTVVAGD